MPRVSPFAGPVLKAALPTARIESGPTALPEGDRIAFVASWSDSPAVTRSLAEYVRQLQLAGYTVVLIRASDDPTPLRWPAGIVLPAAPTVVRKNNVGYDFGSWSVGMELFPQALRRPFVVLTNDSLIGPFDDTSVAAMLAAFEAGTADVWGATSTLQFLPHLQSYLLGFRGGALAGRGLRAFWRSLPVETDKLRIVARYELELSRTMFGEALSTEAFIGSELVVPDGHNPTIQGWDALLAHGFPFIKRTIVTQPELVGGLPRVVRAVRERFGQDLSEWTELA